MTALTQFTCFKTLPIEIRLRIWEFAANNTPRTLDIWTDWVHCNTDNTTFYCQKYFCELSNLTPPAILHVCKESRSEGLKSYVVEYTTEMRGVKMESHFYINYATDILIPRGYWNMISFEHFVSRAALGGLVTLAVDISGNFWKDNLKHYVVMDHWVFNGIDELYLYESSKDGMWKESNYLDKFRNRTMGVRRDLEFESLEEPGQGLKDVMAFLDRHFDIMEDPLLSKTSDIVERKPTYLVNLKPTPATELMRPQIKCMNLLDKDPMAQFTSDSSADTPVPEPEVS